MFLLEIPLGKLSSWDRFEIGPRGIFEKPHEGCKKFNKAKPS